MIVQGTQRVQRGAPVALGLAGADDHQHLGPVQRQQADGCVGAGAQGFEGLDVTADPLGQFAAGECGIAKEQHRTIGVAAQSSDGEVAGMQGVTQQVLWGHGQHRLTADTARLASARWSANSL